MIGIAGKVRSLVLISGRQCFCRNGRLVSGAMLLQVLLFSGLLQLAVLSCQLKVFKIAAQ
jgi:hypothetical protein